MKKSIVILRSVKDKDLQAIVKEIMEACAWAEIVKPNAKVILKPNLSTDVAGKVEMSNTSPHLLEAVCKVLLTRTKNLTVVESDGARYPAERAAENTGILEVVRRLGIRWVNLSKSECVRVDHKIFNRYGTLLSKEVLETDVLISLPVIKTHALTVFTGAIKNLWGCVPRYDRIWMHKYLDVLLADLIGICKPQLSIMDGIMCSEGRGPVNGIPRRLDLVMASCDPVALDATAMRLIGLDPYTSRHIVFSSRGGYGNISEENIDIHGDFAGLKVEFIPPIQDFAVKSMNFMTRYRWFVKYILFNEKIFFHTRRLVIFLRKIGYLNDAPEKPKVRYEV